MEGDVPTEGGGLSVSFQTIAIIATIVVAIVAVLGFALSRSDRYESKEMADERAKALADRQVQTEHNYDYVLSLITANQAQLTQVVSALGSLAQIVAAQTVRLDALEASGGASHQAKDRADLWKQIGAARSRSEEDRKIIEGLNARIDNLIDERTPKPEPESKAPDRDATSEYWHRPKDHRDGPYPPNAQAPSSGVPSVVGVAPSVPSVPNVGAGTALGGVFH